MSRIPPLPALRAFLAACRRGSFTAAAEELNVTHGAVSRQVQQLEEWLGQTLFERSGQRMVATPHALAFAQEVGEAMQRIDDAARRYGRGSASSLLRVNAPATFAMRWLIPRLPDFYARHPGVQVQVQTATTQQLTLAGSFDAAIRVGALNHNKHFTALPFLDEWHVLLAAPALLQQRPLNSVAQLADHVLLETETRPGLWQQWLNVAGYRDEADMRRQRFDHFYVTYSALVDGLGVALGPLPTLDRDIQAGRLVHCLPDIRTPPQRYYCLTPAGVPKTLAHRQFEEWLTDHDGLLASGQN